MRSQTHVPKGHFLQNRQVLESDTRYPRNLNLPRRLTCPWGLVVGVDFSDHVGIAIAARSQLAARARRWRWVARRCEDDHHAAPVDAMAWSADRQCGDAGIFVF